MLKNFGWIAVCVSLLCLRPAAAETFDFDQGIDAKTVIQTIQDKHAREDGAANWTIMVYVNAKNNLERFGLSDMNEMEQIGSTSKVKIAVELGRIAGYDSSDGDWTGQRRFIVQKDADRSHVTSPVLQEIPKADMGDWKHLVEFVAWAKEAAPARHYMLVVWNHGSGWSRVHAVNDISTLGISYDDETGNHITTPQMGTAMSQIGKVDIHASDACLMQMAEVGYEMKEYADFLVASEETEPGDGYTYDKLLGPLAANPGMSAQELAKLTAQAYTDHYAAQGEGATQSSIRAAQLPALLTALNGWTEAVMAAGETAVVKDAHSLAQEFYFSDNKDLLDFVRRVDAGTQNAAVKDAGAKLEKLLTGGVIAHNAITGSNYANATGLAIYLPGYGYNKSYDELAWAKDGGWAKFAKWVASLRETGSGK